MSNIPYENLLNIAKGSMGLAEQIPDGITGDDLKNLILENQLKYRRP
jgi:hypothetical protein